MYDKIIISSIWLACLLITVQKFLKILCSLFQLKNSMMIHCCVLFDKLRINHIITEYALLGLLHSEAHLCRHAVLVARNNQMINRVKEESLRKNVTEFWPRILVQEDVKSLYQYDFLILFVEEYLVLLGVLLGVVEVREATFSVFKTGLNILNKFLGIKSKFCSSSGVCVDRIFHFI